MIGKELIKQILDKGLTDSEIVTSHVDEDEGIDITGEIISLSADDESGELTETGILQIGNFNTDM